MPHIRSFETDDRLVKFLCSFDATMTAVYKIEGSNVAQLISFPDSVFIAPSPQPTPDVAALEVLKKIEWLGVGGVYNRCPVCNSYQHGHAHAANCALDAALSTRT